VTVPSGGTSDYASEMIHAAARGEPYACFVRPDSRIPFMAMPDAIESLLKLSAAQRNRLSCTAYNVRAFNPSADEIRESAMRAFPNAKITYRVDGKRQTIIDSWPEDVDDTSARRDWDFAPSYDFDRAFHEYLIPTIRDRHGLHRARAKR
jgi:threonine 3-dehydrogenase